MRTPNTTAVMDNITLSHIVRFKNVHTTYEVLTVTLLNPLNAELNPIRHLLALAGAHQFVDVSRIRVNR
jgi:hypothetical protein